MPGPTKYLFESEQTNTAYLTRTTQQVFGLPKHMAHIAGDAGIHCLRHNLATHLADKGIDTRNIKDLLGSFQH